MTGSFLSDLIDPDRILLNEGISSKKKALDLLSEIFHNTLLQSCDEADLSRKSLLDAFIAREKLGSTALEHGVAIPHCRIDACDTPIIALITLDSSIDFESDSNMPINLICGLIVPSEAHQDHLDILAALVKLLGIEENRETIHQAQSSTEVFELLKTVSLN